MFTMTILGFVLLPKAPATAAIDFSDIGLANRAIVIEAGFPGSILCKRKKKGALNRTMDPRLTGTVSGQETPKNPTKRGRARPVGF